MSCYLIRYRCSKRFSRPKTVVKDFETQSLSNDSFDRTPCQINYAKCFTTRGPPAPERDWFGCDEVGNYKELQWSHPMSQEHHCRDRVTGQEIEGTRRSRKEPLDCEAYQNPKARQPKRINFTPRRY
jgi:hypothetical protein